jgi:hypothetical protein
MSRLLAYVQYNVSMRIYNTLNDQKLKFATGRVLQIFLLQFYVLLRTVLGSRNEPLHVGGARAGAGAMTRWGSGSKADVQHRETVKNVTKCGNLILFQFISTNFQSFGNQRNKQFQYL